MCTRRPITRTSIKLRNPIKREMCTCHNYSVVYIDRMPSYIVINDMPMNELEDLVSDLQSCVTMIFDIKNGDYSGARYCLRKGIPVIIKTSEVVPEDILVRMKEIPHCALQVSIGFLRNFPSNPLAECSGSLFALRKMIHLAKSWRIFVILHVDQSENIRLFDIYEVIEMTKMSIGHCTVNSYDLQFYKKIKEYCEYKKISVDIEPDYSNRVSDIDSKFLGLRTFMYKGYGDIFIESGFMDDMCTCSKCGKGII